MTTSIGGANGRSTNLYQTMPHATAGDNSRTQIQLDTEGHDTMNGADLENDRIVIPSDGMYLLIGTVNLDSVSDGWEIDTIVRVNGETKAAGTTMPSGPDGAFGATGTDVKPLEEGDKVTLHVAQNSGSQLDTNPGEVAVHLTVTEV